MRVWLSVYFTIQLTQQIIIVTVCKALQADTWQEDKNAVLWYFLRTLSQSVVIKVRKVSPEKPWWSIRFSLHSSSKVFISLFGKSQWGNDSSGCLNLLKIVYTMLGISPFHGAWNKSMWDPLRENKHFSCLASKPGHYVHCVSDFSFIYHVGWGSRSVTLGTLPLLVFIAQQFIWNSFSCQPC